MFGEVAFERKTFATPAALVRLFARVRLDMGPQVGFICEGFSADVARKRFFARVGSDVTWKLKKHF